MLSWVYNVITWYSILIIFLQNSTNIFQYHQTKIAWIELRQTFILVKMIILQHINGKVQFRINFCWCMRHIHFKISLTNHPLEDASIFQHLRKSNTLLYKNTFFDPAGKLPAYMGKLRCTWSGEPTSAEDSGNGLVR